MQKENTEIDQSKLYCLEKACELKDVLLTKTLLEILTEEEFKFLIRFNQKILMFLLENIDDPCFEGILTLKDKIFSLNHNPIFLFTILRWISVIPKKEAFDFYIKKVNFEIVSLDENGKNILMMLCGYGDPSDCKLIESLLQNENFDIDLKDNQGWTALMLACRYSKKNSNTNSTIEIVKLLLQNEKIDVNLKEKDGSTALMMACRHSNDGSDTETVNLLIQNDKIDVNLKDNGGWTALMMACGYSNTDSNIETVKLLLQNNKVDVNLQSKNGFTALMLACRYSNTNSNVETVKLLLQNEKVDVNLQNKNGSTALMMACRYSNTGSNIETVKLLLRNEKVDVNLKNNDGYTALMIISKIENSEEATNLLLKSGAHIDELKNYKNYHDLIKKEIEKRQRNAIGVLFLSTKKESPSTCSCCNSCKKKRKKDDFEEHPLRELSKELIHSILSFSHPLIQQTRHCRRN